MASLKQDVCGKYLSIYCILLNLSNILYLSSWAELV